MVFDYIKKLEKSGLEKIINYQWQTNGGEYARRVNHPV